MSVSIMKQLLFITLDIEGFPFFADRGLSFKELSHVFITLINDSYLDIVVEFLKFGSALLCWSLARVIA